MIAYVEICNWLFTDVTWLSLSDVFSKRITIISIIVLVCFIVKKSKAKYTNRINQLIQDGESIRKTEKIISGWLIDSSTHYILWLAHIELFDWIWPC